jgi:CheY-like chemotaxis protein
VATDPVRVRQVLTNLIGNAVKFTEAGTVSVRMSHEGDRARLEVADTGIGITPDVVGRLFEPFSQADGSTTRRFGGTGLGLAICHQLVALLGGDIGVDSVPGAGSTFWCTFDAPVVDPVALDCADPDVVADGSAIAGAGTVLLVEDNELNQLVASNLLEKLGYRVDVASDGLHGLALFRERTYDAVLMDCQMPVMDGFEATKRIRRLDAGRRHTPVIAMTAAAMSGDRERCLAAGMDDYVAKPVSTEALVGALRRCGCRPLAPGPAPSRSTPAGTLAERLGPAAYRQVMEAFVRTTRDRVESMEDAVAIGDLGEVARVAHSAKGACGTFGADELAELAGKLEQQCVDADVDGAAASVAAFATAFAAVEATLCVSSEGWADVQVRG